MAPTLAPYLVPAQGGVGGAEEGRGEGCPMAIQEPRIAPIITLRARDFPLVLLHSKRMGPLRPWVPRLQATGRGQTGEDFTGRAASEDRAMAPEGVALFPTEEGGGAFHLPGKEVYVRSYWNSGNSN